MNSPPFEVKTSCKDCCYAQYEGSLQTGCGQHRLEKFIQLGKTQLVDGSYQISRVCNLRNVLPNDINRSPRETIACTFGIAIYDMGGLVCDDAIRSIESIEYIPQKYFYSIISNKNHRAGTLMNYVNKLRSLGVTGEFRMTIRYDGEQQDLIDKPLFMSLAKHNCTYFVKVNHDQTIPPDFLSKVDSSLNDELETAILYEHNGIYAFPFWLINNEYLNYNNIDGFIAAMKEAAIEEGMYKVIT